MRTEATEASGTAERKAALEMIDGHAPGTSNQLTPGADKAYDAREFVGHRNFPHHVAFVT